MGAYSVKMQRAASASASVGGVQAPGASMRRVRIYDFMCGSEGTPADVANLWVLGRTSTAGTSTGVTPAPLDPADSACVAVAGENFSAEPTYGVNLLEIPVNQKASFRWIAAPGCELVIPATANAGVGVKTPTAGSSVNITTTIHFIE